MQYTLIQSQVEEWHKAISLCMVSIEGEDKKLIERITSIDIFWAEFSTFVRNYPQSPALSEVQFLYPVIQENVRNSVALLEVLDGAVEISPLWGLLLVDIKLAFQIEMKTASHLDNSTKTERNTRNLKSKALEWSAIVEVSQVLKDIFRRIEVFNPRNIASLSDFRKKEISLEFHIWLLDILKAIYECCRKGFTRQQDKESWICLGQSWTNIVEQIQKQSDHLSTLQTVSLGAIVERLRSVDTLTPRHNAKLPYRGNFPVRQNPHFRGRQTALASIEQCLKQNPEDPKLLSLAISGLGGVGKTQVALEVMHRHALEYDALFWIHGETPEAIVEDFSKIAIELELSGVTPHERANNCLVFLNWLQTTDASWLMTFDNVENAPLLEQHWPKRGAGQIMVTSRAATVGFKLGCQGFELPTLSEDEGADLVIHLLGRNPETEAASALELSRKLNGHALAINQMAAIIKESDISINRFLMLYDKNVKAFHRKHLDTRPEGYNYYLDTVWEMSFEELKSSTSASTLLGVLSFLVPDSIPRKLFIRDEEFHCSEELAFCKDELDLIDAESKLVSLALARAQYQTDTGEYSMHRLMQTEFCYHISPREWQRLFENATILLYDAFPQQVDGRVMHAQWDTCQLYIQHVLSLAFHYAIKVKHLEALRPSRKFCKLLCSCAWYLYERGSQQFESLIDIGLKAYYDCDEIEQDPLNLAHLLNSKGILYLDSGRFDEAEKLLEDCKRIRLEQLDPDHGELAAIYNNLGNLAYSQFQYKKALELQLKAEVIRLKNSDEKTRAQSNQNIGRALWRLEQKQEALKRVLMAERTYSTTGSWFLQARTCLLLGTLYREDHDIPTAKSYYLKGESIMKAAPAHYTTSVLLYKLGCVALDEKEFPTAIKYLEDSLVILKAIPIANVKGDLARVLHKLGQALSQSKDEVHKERASKNFRQAENLRMDIQKEKYDENDQSEEAYDSLVCGNSR